MLADGEFDKQVGNDGVDVWVTQMGGYMNMNTAFIDKKNGIVAIVDPFDSVVIPTDSTVSAMRLQGL